MKRSVKIKAAGFALLGAGLVAPLFPETKNHTLNLFRQVAMYTCDIAGSALAGAGFAVYYAEKFNESLKPSPDDQRYLPKKQITYPEKKEAITPA